MNKTLRALVLKLVAIGLTLVVLMPIFGRLTSGQALITALVLTVFAYVFGDLQILPRFGNVVATIVDAVTAALVIGAADWIVNGAITLTPTGWVLILGILSVAEWFFHRYLNLAPVTVGGGPEL